MANIKSAIRRAKKSKKQALINRARKSKYKSAVKQMTIYLNSGKIKEARNFLPKFHSQLMKIAKTGAVNKKTASRKISRISKKIKNLKK
tara:strand:- start:158 stop:424 length:267 start_codon:yes stop_codon:yes gene_type:complete